MSEVQQSPSYARYMTRLKWTVLTVEGVQVFFRTFPFAGSIMKMHRPVKLPSFGAFARLIRTHNIKTLVIEPDASQDAKLLNHWCKRMSKEVHLYRGTPFLPTKTIRVDLKLTEQALFSNFSEAKRRAVRRSVNLGVTVRKSDDINDLIRIKKTSSGLFGFITTTGIDALWDVFAPKQATILLAWRESKIIGGVLLLFWDRVSYYWIAGASHEGKKLFAPTLLVWEALRESKRQGCSVFDFIGVWDERTPTLNRDWFGFTKFKEGFGGTPVHYPLMDKP